MWKNSNLYALLVGLQNDGGTVESSMAGTPKLNMEFS